jgi:hypothetical protein
MELEEEKIFEIMNNIIQVEQLFSINWEESWIITLRKLKEIVNITIFVDESEEKTLFW